MACYEYKGVKYTEEDLVKLLQSQQPKTRRILEVQSDLFQKAKKNFTLGSNQYAIQKVNNEDVYELMKGGSPPVKISKEKYLEAFQAYLDGGGLASTSKVNGQPSNDTIQKEKDGTYAIYNKEIGFIEGGFTTIEKAKNWLGITQNEGNFLNLLQRDNNWVTFFVKSIIQDTAKQTITEVQESDVEAKVRELEKEGLLEIDCKGFKAKEGLTTNSNPKFGDWEIIKDLKGKPSHEQGGIDLSIKGNTIEAEGNELVLKNSVGDLAIIPKKDRSKIKDLISNNDEKGLTNYISKLPKEPNKAGDGGIYSDKYVKNNFFNRIFRRNNILEKQIMDENKSLYNVGKLKDFKVLEATGKSKQHLEETNRNPEYFPKGDTWFPYLDDISQPIKLPNKNKYRTLVNDDNLSDYQLRNAVKFDFISHSLHNDKRYNDLSTQLSQKLLTKYDQKFIDNNGGVDAYVRGILSDSEDYKPYRDETSFVEPEFINEIKNYVKTGK